MNWIKNGSEVSYYKLNSVMCLLFQKVSFLEVFMVTAYQTKIS
jgi:hypothetical protein